MARPYCGHRETCLNARAASIRSLKVFYAADVVAAGTGAWLATSSTALLLLLLSTGGSRDCVWAPTECLTARRNWRRLYRKRRCRIWRNIQESVRLSFSWCRAVMSRDDRSRDFSALISSCLHWFGVIDPIGSSSYWNFNGLEFQIYFTKSFIVDNYFCQPRPTSGLFIFLQYIVGYQQKIFIL